MSTPTCCLWARLETGSTSIAAVQRPWWMFAIVGNMNKCLRQQLIQSAQPLLIHTSETREADCLLCQGWRQAQSSMKGCTWSPGLFPAVITTTTLRPNVIILSTTSRRVFILEMTVPWEDRGGHRKEENGALPQNRILKSL